MKIPYVFSKWHSLSLMSLVAMALIFAVSSSADALSIRLYDGSTTVTVADGAGGDLNPLAGAVVYSGGIGNWIVNVTTGLSMPVIGSAALPELDLNSINVSSAATGTLTISVSDNDFGPLAPGVTGFSTLIGGTTGGAVTLESYYDTSNALFGTGTLLAEMGPFSGAFSGTEAYSGIPGADPFSLTMVAQITHGGGIRSSSFDAAIAPVPEPATIMLMGAGLIGLGGWARRRQPKDKAKV